MSGTTTTTAPESTTTTAAQNTTTTAGSGGGTTTTAGNTADATAASASTPRNALAFSGSSTYLLASLGLALILIGAQLRVSAARRQTVS